MVFVRLRREGRPERMSKGDLKNPTIRDLPQLDPIEPHRRTAPLEGLADSLALSLGNRPRESRWREAG